MSDLSNRADRSAIYADLNGNKWAVERHGDRVLLIFGVPAAAREAARQEVWKTWTVK